MTGPFDAKQESPLSAKAPKRRSRRPIRNPRVAVVTPVLIDFNKRVVAFIIDVAVAYLIGTIMQLLPLINTFLNSQITMVLILLVRDYFFAGRGIGKNLMGLRVVSIYTGAGPTIVQSIRRNLILLAPFIVLQIVQWILAVVPIPFVNEGIKELILVAGMLYIAIFFPLEAYRAYSRSDSLRLGDEMAETTLVESHMDFSTIVPKQSR